MRDPIFIQRPFKANVQKALATKLKVKETEEQLISFQGLPRGHTVTF